MLVYLSVAKHDLFVFPLLRYSKLAPL
ncbi:BnaA05g32270D [Brassica napus]|uniref:BnaA05g32270D protein n=1 Tax=Brassica napus TaxID=3708 RepID=A0A078I0T1_BRANA|nr:BnaA05g32270D [Brassica napus]